MSSDTDPEADLTRHLWGRRYGTLYRIRLSVLYHLKRERFCDRCDKAANMLTAAAATAAVGVVLKKGGEAEIWAAAITAVLSLIPLVFNPAAAARRHAQCAEAFKRLQAEAELAGERWTEPLCDRFASRILELEAAEPAPLAALVIDCQNQLALGSGHAENVQPLRLHERWLMHWFDFSAEGIRKMHHGAVLDI